MISTNIFLQYTHSDALRLFLLRRGLLSLDELPDLELPELLPLELLLSLELLPLDDDRLLEPEELAKQKEI